MYKPKYFQLYELVPKDIFEAHNGSEILWYLFDDRILLAADLIRIKYGPCRINDWKWGGACHFRGYRPMDCPKGVPLSQHKFGRALDISVRDVESETIRKDILAGQAASGLITCIEANTPHLHIDCRLPESNGKIKIVYP